MKKLSSKNQRTTAIITHVDGITKVKATADLYPDKVLLYWKAEGTDWSREITHDEAVKMGIMDVCSTEEYRSFEKDVAEKLKKYPLLKWQSSATVKLAKRLFKSGYSVEETVGVIILNS